MGTRASQVSPVALSSSGVRSLDQALNSPATLTRSREIARAEGLRYVYTGNVHDRTGGTTFCPGCGKPVIVRDWYDLLDYRVTPEGTCSHCGAAIAGRYGPYDGCFGPRRIPVQILRHHA